MAWLGKESSSIAVIWNECNIYLCCVFATMPHDDTSKTDSYLLDNQCRSFSTRVQKNSISFFSFSAKNKSQYWYGNEQKLQSILSKKFVLSDLNLSIANHCPLFWQFTKLFFKNWSKQLNVVNNIKIQIWNTIWELYNKWKLKAKKLECKFTEPDSECI